VAPGRGKARGLAALALAAGGGLAHGACFAPVGAWPLAFVAPAALVLAVRGRTMGAGLALGWVYGTTASTLAAVPWLAAAARDFFAQGPLAAGLFAVTGTQIVGAAPIAAFGAAAARLGRLRSPVGRALAAGAAWAGLETLRSRLFGGAPWDLLGHALAMHPLWIQTADVGGVFLVSFVLVVVAASIAEACVGPARARRAAVATAGVALALSAGYGGLRLAAAADGGEPTLRLALVQGNVPNAWRLSPVRAGDAFRAFAAATRAVLDERPDLVVWPENAVNVLLEPNPRFAEEAAALLGPDGPPLLVGAPRAAPAGETGRVRFFNSAYLLSSRGESLGVYDKRHLVPFAEYAPVAALRGLGGRDTPSEYAPGEAAVVFSRPAPFGVLICFEAIYAELARDLVRGGATFLVNVSSDAWFGTSAGLEQHFAMTVFRAVETRRALARVANGGITAVVGPSGRVLTRFPVDVELARVARVPIRRDETPYTRVGDLFGALAAVAAAAALGRAGRHVG
jgi:apolipoprotein N-acyltransferase